MDRRLVGCSGAALLLHGALAALAAVQPPATPRAASAAVETDIVLVPLPSPPAEPAPHAEAVPIASQRVPLLAPAAVATQPRPSPRSARAVAGVITSTNAEGAAGAVHEPAPEPQPGATSAPGRRLSLEALGLTGTSAAILPPLRDAAAAGAPADVAGLKAALAAHDVALGLGPGGAVADQLRRLVHDLAPLGSQATLAVDLASDGSLDTFWLEDVTSDEQDWRKALHALRVRLGKRFIARGPVRVRLLVTSRSARRAGNSQGGLDFDLSNIGSPTLHTLHVRVLGQSPL